MGSAPAAWRNGFAMGGEGGQAVVEAAFALPLTVVLILCTIQIAQLQQARLLVEYAAFNAARAGVVQNGNDGSDGTAGPMHDAAALSLLSGQGPTDGLGALARTWAGFRAREALLRPRAPARAGVRAEPPARRLPPLRAAPRRPGDRLRRRAAAGGRREPPLHPGALPGRAARASGEQADPFGVPREPRAPVQAGSRRRHSRRPRLSAAGTRGHPGPLLRARTGLPHPAHAVQRLPAVGGAMILLLHRIRRDEDGQVLVLGAIFGLVLMLCVLSTVNLGRAVYAKVQLQTAADAAAYSQAAVEARVLNFTAYTNRAMVVHYASIMAAAAYLAWVHFLWAVIDPVLSVLRNVPYAGPVFAALQEVFRGLLVLLDSAVAVMTPLVSAANVVLYTLQEGAWLAVGAPGGGRLSRLPPEAHSGDSGA